MRAEVMYPIPSRRLRRKIDRRVKWLMRWLLQRRLCLFVPIMMPDIVVAIQDFADRMSRAREQAIMGVLAGPANVEAMGRPAEELALGRKK